jgi:hypothetical protein
MKKLFYTIIQLLIVVNTIAQVNNINNDSLRRMFKTCNNSFEVLEKVRFSAIDYKLCYGDTPLKMELLKWLDRNEYYRFLVENETKRFEKAMENIEVASNEIKYFLNKRTKKIPLDSILKNKDLFSKYRDSAISFHIAKFKDCRDAKKIILPKESIELHSKFHYVEAYKIIRDLWVNEENKGKNNIYFLPLLHMGDPDAQNKYDTIIRKFVETNGKVGGDPMEIIYFLTYHRSSYSLSKIIELLSVNLPIQKISDDPSAPFNCIILNFLIGDIIYNKIKIKYDASEITKCNTSQKNLYIIKTAAMELIKKYKSEEHYWMKNMPFNRLN